MSIKNLVMYKMHGTGNDFLVIDGRIGDIGNLFEVDATSGTSTLVSQLGHRKMGIGFDQLLLIVNPTNSEAQIFMKIFNNDGSSAGMCGNGVRCAAYFARYLADCPLQTNNFKVETSSRIVGVTILDRPNPSFEKERHSMITDEINVCVDMGAPQILNSCQSFCVNDLEVCGYSISMGNPHFVIFLEPHNGNSRQTFAQQLSAFPVHEYGPLIEEMTSIFPEKTNVEFVAADGNDLTCVKMRVWERGAGETLSCGSGACAVGAASLLRQRQQDPHCKTTEIAVHLPGGVLQIEWNPEQEGASLYQSGPASCVARIDLNVMLK